MSYSNRDSLYRAMDSKLQRVLNTITGILLITAGIFFIGLQIYQYFERQDIEKYGIETIGIVDKINKEKEGNKYWYTCLVQYTDSNQDTFFIETNEELEPQYKLGEQLTLHYLIDNLSASVIAGSYSFDIVLCLIMVFIIFMGIYVLFIVGLWYHNHR